MKKTTRFYASICTATAAAVLCGLGGSVPLSASAAAPSSLSRVGNFIIKNVLENAYTTIKDAQPGEPGSIVAGLSVYPQSVIDFSDLHNTDNYTTFDIVESDNYYYKLLVPNVSDTDGDTVYGEMITEGGSSSSSYSSAPVVTASAAPTLSGGTVVPASLTQGYGVIVRGAVKSSSRLTAVTVAVYDANNKRVTGKTVYPAAYSYDLNNVDDFILFNELAPGAYTYQVIAANADSNNHVLTSQPFTVKASSASSGSTSAGTGDCITSSVRLTGGTDVPSSLTKGQGVSVKGTVTSDSAITALTAGIYDSNGTIVYGKRVYPNTRSYDISALDNCIAFSQLNSGTYTYQVIAANGDGNNHVLTKQTFTVKSSSSNTETNGSSVMLTGGTTVPKTLVRGYGVIVRGTVKSPDSKITTLTVAVYDENNKRMTGKTIYPSAYSYNLNDLDDYVLFSDLEPGTYSYQVIAANADDNNQVLTNQTFTVKSSSGSSGTEGTEINGDSVTLTGGTVVPSQIAEGNGVIVRGTVKSPYSRISALLVAIYDKNNTLVTGKRVYPDAYSYNLGKLDNYVLFSQLEPGTYSYQVVAANADNNNHVLSNQPFTVKGKSSSGNTETESGTETETQPEASGESVTLTGGTSVPTSIREGEGVSVLGTVKSSSVLTALTVAVYDENNVRVTGKTVYPGTYSYKLSQLDDSVRFSDLKPGTYSYQVIAANSDGNNHILTKQSFTVKSESSSSSSSSSSGSVSDTQSAVLMRGTAVPSQITAGNGVTVRGTVESTSNLTALTVAVYDADGTLVTGKTVYPGTRLYNLGLLDAAVRFSDLTAGTYSYQVIAANADSENIVLTNQSFRVTE